MKQNTLTKLCVVIFITLITSCNQPGSAGKISTTDSASTVEYKDTPAMPAYDPAMDPIKVEAAFAKVLGDTLNIKMYEVTLKPGDTSLAHTHPDYSLYVLQGGKIAISANGGRQEMELKAGMGIIFGSVTHSAKNIGNTTIKLLVNDIYRPLGK